MLVLGCGAICSVALPIILDVVDIDPSRITVVEMDESKKELISSSISKGVKFINYKISAENRCSFLSQHLTKGDFLLDLAWEIDTCEQMIWCKENKVLFLNTSLEVWNPVGEALNNNPSPIYRTLFQRHRALHEIISKWNLSNTSNNDHLCPTLIYEHGANPGLVSYLTKKALTDLATKLIHDEKVELSRKKNLQHALDTQDFARVCMLSGTKTIHISERDTQVSKLPKLVNEFVNTWSIEGYYEEGIAPVEMCWGSHERHIPDGTYYHPISTTPANSNLTGIPSHITLSQPGWRTWGRSYVPGDGGNITGMLIPHGESVTIGNHLTVKDESGHILYRPTVYFVYCPSDAACASAKEVESRGYQLAGLTLRMMNDDIIAGEDKLGVLLLGHDYKAWWTGSLLSIDEARNLVPGQNATSMQVQFEYLYGNTFIIYVSVYLPFQLLMIFMIVPMNAMFRRWQLEP